MGKNQQYKQRQMAKAASRGGGGGGGEEDTGDGMVDGSFHSPEWHAARLAALQTTHTLTWEEWKAQRKEELRKQNEADSFEERRMREYRQQLDREREERLAKGRNHAEKRDKLKKKDKKSKKDKDKKKDKSKRKKREGSDSDSDRKKKKKKKKDDGDSLSSASSEEEGNKEGPVRLSSFFQKEEGDLSSDDEEEDKKKGGEGKPGKGSTGSMSELLEEAKRRAEIGLHMVKEVKKADVIKR